MDGLDAGKLLAMICDRSGITRHKIGRIDLKGAYSFFEVDSDSTNVVRDHLHGFEFKGRMVRIEVTDNGSSKSRKSFRKAEVAKAVIASERNRGSGNDAYGVASCWTLQGQFEPSR